jgi:3D (Asp-Asp-Asp) domain-containing protein
MTQLAYNMAFLKRAARVTVVALCTACSLALLGAFPANEAKGAKAAPKAAAVKAKEVISPAIKSVTPDTELMVADAQPAKATIPAERRTRIIRMEVTAYCPCVKCCGPSAQGITASGRPVSHNGGKFVAADTSVLGFGTKIVVPGYAADQQVEVIDRGGAIKGNKLDLYFASHAEALEWGRQQLDVTVFEN